MDEEEVEASTGWSKMVCVPCQYLPVNRRRFFSPGNADSVAWNVKLRSLLAVTFSAVPEKIL
jgi:hypothetical protein